MTNPIFDLAKKDNERLKAELLASTVAQLFRDYLRTFQVMEIMKEGADAPGAPTRIRSAKPTNDGVEAKTGSEAARVRAAAKAYLSKEHRRRTSGQIATALMADGVEIGGDKPGSRVSAHLSADVTTFDNDREDGGYGLREWAK